MQVNFALAAVINAKQRAHNFRASGAHQPGNAQNFAFAQIKGNVVEHARLAQVFNFQNYFAGFGGASGIIFRNSTANHILYYGFHGSAACRAAAYGVAVAHNGNGIAVGKYFFHAVRNINNGYAFVL